MQLNENNLIETMFDVMPFSVYVVDVNTMEIIHMNRAMIGRRGGNFTGRICYEALYEAESPCIFCKMNEILGQNRKPNGVSVTHDHFDDMDDCWYQIQDKAITWPDGRVVKCSIAVDISELKDMQNHLAEAHAQLALKNRELEDATRHKSEFLANISHEIRTPLNAIIGLSDLAIKTELTLKQRDYIKKINRSSTSLLRILNDILDFSKIEAGRIDLEHLPFDLPQMLDEVSGMFYHAASKKFIELLLSLDSKVPWFVIGDPFRLGQILSNLISNAVKFTDSGQILIKVNLIDKRDDEVTIRFAVSDTGIGIPEDVIPLLFKSFTQADASTTRRYGGTGLGLTICKKMVELMNGTIWVESVRGEGATFTFEVKLKLQERELKRKSFRSSQIDGINVLLADDNPVSLGVMVKILESFGCSITPVDSGESALELLRNFPDDKPFFDLLITDWHMKQINGIELAAILKKDLRLAKLPIILISAFDKDGLLMGLSGNAGIDAFIAKPVNHSILFETIMDVIRNVDKSGNITRVAKTEITSDEITVKENLQNRHILVVDDNSINLQIARELLERVGVVVDTEQNAANAVARALSCPYDIILMDVNMPDLDGHEATKKMRSHFVKSPIIAMTAHSTSQERSKAVNSGMDDFISKPIDSNVLYHVLLKWISPENTLGKSYPDIESGQLGKSHHDIESGQLGKSHHDIESDQLNEPEILIESEPSNEPEHLIESEPSNGSEHLIESDPLSGPDPLLEYFKSHGTCDSSAVARSVSSEFDEIIDDDNVEISDVASDAIADDSVSGANSVDSSSGSKAIGSSSGSKAVGSSSGSKALDSSSATKAVDFSSSGFRENGSYSDFTKTESPLTSKIFKKVSDDVKVLDTASGINRLAGNKALYRELLAQYLNENVSKLTELKHTMESGGFEHASKIAHYIKGVSGNISLDRVFYYSGILETALLCYSSGEKICKGEGEYLCGLWELYLSLESETCTGVQVIEKWLENESSDAVKEDVKKSFDLETELRNLLFMLKENNSKALDQVKVVMSSDIFGEMEHARQIEMNINSLDFEAAIDLVRRVASDLSIVL
ncbi:putative Histidine kinase [Desulfamplus magnetovallimortis]|uniref:Sensory/regulatory protein RpfC n=1 Tax=Desulfamplus magnetovallimortis TaxID=1246637 RepID=A0A1W1H7A9_9BACT|nr:response regulator [Desulfamplus magnetovallimortis]SLM28349.1 putative Histidine kinase [Desulfamplus magnetovallimortis]